MINVYKTSRDQEVTNYEPIMRERERKHQIDYEPGVLDQRRNGERILNVGGVENIRL